MVSEVVSERATETALESALVSAWVLAKALAPGSALGSERPWVRVLAEERTPSVLFFHPCEMQYRMPCKADCLRRPRNSPLHMACNFGWNSVLPLCKHLHRN